MFDFYNTLKTILIVSSVVLFISLGVSIFKVYAREAKKDAAKKAKTEALMLKPNTHIPGGPDMQAIEKEWKKELLAFTSTYVDSTKDFVTNNDRRFAHACQEAAQGCADFRSIHEGVMTKERQDCHSAMLGMRSRIDDFARARRRITQLDDQSEVMLYTPRASDLAKYKERWADIGDQIDATRDTLARLKQDHETLFPKAKTTIRQANLLLILVEKNIEHALSWLKDKEVFAYLMSDIARDLERAEQAAQEPAKLLENGERDTENFARGTRRLVVLSVQTNELKNEIDREKINRGLITQPAHDLASRLLSQADTRTLSVQIYVGESGPKDWSAISQRIWHSVHETELALWIAGKVPIKT